MLIDEKYNYRIAYGWFLHYADSKHNKAHKMLIFRREGD